MALVGPDTAFAQSKRNRAAKELVREKLELSQRVLEGLATEDSDIIIAKGTRLTAMSKEADWRAFENPDYDQQSAIAVLVLKAIARVPKIRVLPMNLC